MVWLSDWAALRANFGNTGTGKAWTDAAARDFRASVTRVLRGARLEGTVQRVLVEGPSRHDEGVVCGRTSTFAMLNFPGSEALVGRLVDVRVHRGFTHSARGELVAGA